MDAYPRKSFYFIRHGQTDVNTDPDTKLVDADLPLNQTGIKEALRAREIVETLPFKHVISSPIRRAVDTKNILIAGRGIDCELREEFSECKAHIWTDMVNHKFSDEVTRYLERVEKGLKYVLEKEGPILVVSHGGAHYALCRFLAIKNHPWNIGNCELVHFQPDGPHNWIAQISCGKGLGLEHQQS